MTKCDFRTELGWLRLAGSAVLGANGEIDLFDCPESGAELR